MLHIHIYIYYIHVFNILYYNHLYHISFTSQLILLRRKSRIAKFRKKCRCRYQYSLQFFASLFEQRLAASARSDDPQESGPQGTRGSRGPRPWRIFEVGMGQLVGWTSIYQLFWGSLGTRVLSWPVLSHGGLGWELGVTNQFLEILLI